MSPRSTDQKKRLARAADVDLHIVNFTTTENGRINISFYVTLSHEVLLADPLEALLNKASTSNTTLTQSGISVVEVHQPRGVIATPEQMSGSSSSQVLIFGMSLATLSVLIVIGALGCMITAGYVIHLVPSLYNILSQYRNEFKYQIL